MVQQRERTAQASGWRNERHESSDGYGPIIKRLPVAAVPAMAQLGMVVLPSGGGGYAVIVDMTQETCTVRDEHGAIEVLRWPEVSLDFVRPPASARQLGKAGR